MEKFRGANVSGAPLARFPHRRPDALRLREDRRLIRQRGSGAALTFKLHFTPTSASWLNLVERFFAEITRKRIRRGTFTSVADLEQAIEDYLLRHNANPKPFVWTKTARTILEKERRALDLLDLIKTGY